MTKYRITQCNRYSRTLWIVREGHNELSHHEYRSDAEAAVRRYIADDRDYAKYAELERQGR